MGILHHWALGKLNSMGSWCTKLSDYMGGWCWRKLNSINLTTPGSVVRRASVVRHVTDCATGHGTGLVKQTICANVPCSIPNINPAVFYVISCLNVLNFEFRPV